jgi:hypothetical protein
MLNWKTVTSIAVIAVPIVLLVVSAALAVCTPFLPKDRPVAVRAGRGAHEARGGAPA